MTESQPSSRASSSSTTDGSSLVKTGVGLSTFAPTTTGLLSQGGVLDQLRAKGFEVKTPGEE